MSQYVITGIRNALHIAGSYLNDPSLQKGVEMQLNRNFEFRHVLIDLVEETLEFVEALLRQLLTPTIRLPNFSQRATQCTVFLNYKYCYRH